ncbi:RES domain-containing protein [Bacillus thuringiensis]|uniref:RES domain-containing protein n=1 Tax=Bacillus cereus TaxID=1396 RepID=UPI0011AB40E2|nr:MULTISPECIES: RES domain-containing protein [Bacillus cereus group]MED2143123.1 RES domain-containing protein [Bacillus thuringiensis]MED2519858.1 RES domain-containing protein [Bacillus thuringiensis]
MIELIKSKRVVGDECNYCGSKGVSVAKVSDLLDMFNNLFTYFVKSEPEKYIYMDGMPTIEEAYGTGENLWDLLREEWDVFSDITDENLLYDILNANKDVEKEGIISANTMFYTAMDVSDHFNVGDWWNDLADSLKHKNRFFPQISSCSRKNDDLLDYLGMLFLSISTTVGENDKFYRARIGEYAKSTELEAPPEEKILKSGRANPVGIRVLYTAIDEETAVAEVRPWKSAKVTIASVKPKEPLKLVDLSKVSDRMDKILKSPFSVENIYNELTALNVLSNLDKALSKPVSPDTSELDYIPSQYLTEYIKFLGYDGVIFRSSLGPGENYVFYEQENKFWMPKSKLNVEILELYEVSGLKYDFSIIPKHVMPGVKL